MFRCWFKDNGLVGFTPVDFSPTDEGNYRGVVGDGEGDGEDEISER
jgi:hypothetical protein